MEKNLNFGFICLNNPKKYSFGIKLTPGDAYIMTLEELIKMAKERVNKLGTGIGKLYDYYHNTYGDDSENLKRKVIYYKELFPFKFDEPKKIKIKLSFLNEFTGVEDVKELELFPYSTLEVLSKEVHSTFGCPLQEQKLLFGDTKLDDPSKMLSEYNIKAGSTIKLFVVETKENNRISFVDVTKDNFQDIKFSDDAPDYSICGRGINIEGICENKNCKAYKKQVVCPIRKTTVFDVIREQFKIICPICSKKIKALTCGFTRCKYTFAGIKYEKNEMIEVQSQILTSVGKFYRYFDPIQSGKVDWESLKIIVKFDSTDLDETDAQTVICSVCDKTDSLNSNLKKRDDFNIYLHDNCYELFKELKTEVYSRW